MVERSGAWRELHVSILVDGDLAKLSGRGPLGYIIDETYKGLKELLALKARSGVGRIGGVFEVRMSWRPEL